MRAVVAVILVLAVAAGGGWAYWQFVMVPAAQLRSQAGQQQGGFAIPVEAATVAVGAAERRINAVGTLRSNESIIVRPEIAGRVKTINFTEGEKVEKGRVLVQLDDTVERAELAQAQAQFALARQNLERADELTRRGAGTQRALDEARATLRTAEAAVQLSQARLEKLVITAPFDGIVGLRQVSVGGFLQAGAAIANLEQIDPLKADFRVPEIFLAAVRAGQPVTITVDAFPADTFSGEVMAIDPLIDAAGRSIVIRARLPNPGDRLRPGLFGRVTLTLATRDDAVFVPEEALVPQGNRHFLFKVVDGGEGKAKTVKNTEVKIGQRRNGKVEIVEGLAAGDQVVTAGLLKIRDGAPVQIMAPAKGGAAPGAGPAKTSGG